MSGRSFFLQPVVRLLLHFFRLEGVSNVKPDKMAILRERDARTVTVRVGVERKQISGNNLMTTVIDFSNGPWDKPDTPHHHVHEQTTYVAEGEIIFFCEGEPEQRLKRGDMFYVPSGKEHTVQLLTPTVRLVDSFNPIREDFL